MSFGHIYSQTVADGTATSVVRPSDWNSVHMQSGTLSGNTSGTSTFTATNVVYQGGNNVTLSLSTGASLATIIFSANQGTVNLYAVSNTTQSTSGTVDGRSISFGGAGGISVGITGNSVVVSGRNVQFSQFVPNALGNNTAGLSLGNSSLYFEPMQVPEALSFNRFQQMVSLSLLNLTVQTDSTGGISNSWALTRSYGLYTRGTGANSTQLSLLASTSASLGVFASVSVASAAGPNITLSMTNAIAFQNNINATGGLTASTFTLSGTTASAASSVSRSNALSDASGVAMMPVAWGTSLSAGDYWFAAVGRSSSTSAGVNVTQASMSNIIMTNINANLKQLGSTVSSGTVQLQPGAGIWTVGTAALPTTVALSDITNLSNAQQFVAFANAVI